MQGSIGALKPEREGRLTVRLVGAFVSHPREQISSFPELCKFSVVQYLKKNYFWKKKREKNYFLNSSKRWPSSVPGPEMTTLSFYRRTILRLPAI